MYSIEKEKFIIYILLAPPRTRSQALRENQEIEIQHRPTHKKKNGYVSGYVKDISNTSSPTRDRSPDSAISSNSSKWSVSSNISIMGRLSVCADSESVTTLSSVVEEAERGSNGSINFDTVKWVNNAATERTRAATPLIRTSTAANGSLIRHTGNLVAESSNVMEERFLKKAKMAYVNSSFTSELVVHLYIIVSCASSASTKAELEVCYIHLRIFISLVFGYICTAIYHDAIDLYDHVENKHSSITFFQ